jgi:hypothetical protein
MFHYFKIIVSIYHEEKSYFSKSKYSLNLYLEKIKGSRSIEREFRRSSLWFAKRDARNRRAVCVSTKRGSSNHHPNITLSS